MIPSETYEEKSVWCLSSLLVRTVGVAFGVAISNRAGAEAMGLYSLMNGVYGFALTVATSGIHLGVTRTVSETVSRGTSDRVRNLLVRACIFSFSCGLIAACLLGSLAKTIGLLWIKDARVIPSLRLLAVTLPLISLSSVFGGYFTAVHRPYKSAVVQVLEQGVKVSATMLLLSCLTKGGIEQILCALVLGGALAELSSFLVSLSLFCHDKRRNFAKSTRKNVQSETRSLFRITLPLAMTTYIRSALLTVEHILIPQGLRKYGVSHAGALSAYGSVQSMALPVILYPAAFISSFAGLIIPAMAESRVRNENRRIRYMISRVWELSLFFSIGVAGILICFSEEFGRLLYSSEQTGVYIRTLAPLIPIMYLDTATDAALKGLGEEIYSMKVNIADALLSVLLVWILVPRIGVNGYVLTIYVSETFNTVASVTRLLRKTGAAARLIKWVYKPLFSVICATLVSRFLFVTILRFRLSAAALAFHCVVTALLYLGLLMLTRALGREDRQWLSDILLHKAPS